MNVLLIAGGACTALLAVVAVLKMFGRLAATLTRIHDAVTVHLPSGIAENKKAIEDNKAAIDTTRAELKADHAEVRVRLHELHAELRDHVSEHHGVQHG
jgi:hypothetical protein